MCFANGADLILGHSNPDFFTNADPTNCPLNPCEAKKGTNCDEDVSASIVSTAGSFTLIRATEVSLDNVCIICSVGSLVFTNVIGNIKVANPLTPLITSPVDQILPYDPAATAQITITEGYSKYFDTTDAANCPPTNCDLFEPDCSTPFAGDPNDLDADTTYPFSVKYYQNINDGYDYDTCIKCELETLFTNGTQLDIFDINETIKFQQTPICLDALTPKFTLAESDIYFNIETAETIITPNGYTDLFDIADATCIVDSCILKESVTTECDTTIATTRAEVFDAEFKIKFHQDQVPSTNVWCYECSIGSSVFVSKLNMIPTNIMQPKTTPFGDVIRYQDTTSSTPDIVSNSIYDDFFENSDQINCPFTRCSIRENDCGMLWGGIAPQLSFYHIDTNNNVLAEDGMESK